MRKLVELKKINIFLLYLSFYFFMITQCISFEIKGSLIQGGLLIGKVSFGDTIYLNGEEIPTDETGEFMIGLERLHPTKGVIKVVKKNKEVITRNLKIKQRQYKVQKINNLNENKVTPPREFYNRIKKETIRIKKAKSTDIKHSHYHAGFIMPAVGIITGVYGSQRILNGVPKRPHYGIDIANILGTPVVAPSDGVVVMVEKDLYFSGGTVIISHGRGLTSSLLHLKEILVEKGSFVEKGKKIGLMGDTGRATGSHLDWRMELRGIRIDPNLLLKTNNNS